MSHRLYGLKQLSGVFKATIISFIAILAFGIYDFILPIFTEGQASSFAVVGLIVSLVYIASLLAEIPVGLAVNKYGRIKILAIATTAMSILGLVYFFTKDIMLLAFLSIVFGTVSVAFWIPSTVLVRDYSPRQKLSQAEGIYMTITQLGWILGPIIAGIVATLFSDRHNFLLVGAIMLIAMLFSLLIFKNIKIEAKKEIAKGRHRHKPKITLLATIFKEYVGVHKHAAPLYVLTLCAYIWIAIEWAFVAIAGIARFGFTEIGMGIVLGAMMAVEGLLYFSSGFIMDKIGKKYIITAGFLLLFASAYFMFLSINPLIFILSALMAAGAVSWILPGTEALLTEIVPANLYGEMSGVFDTAKDFGMIIGPLSAGILATTFSNVLAPFLLVTVVTGLAALVAGWAFWPSGKEVKHHGR